MSIKESIKGGYLNSVGLSGSNPCPAAKRAKQSHRSSYMRFVEGLLGAMASLETSSEKPAAL